MGGSRTSGLWMTSSPVFDPELVEARRIQPETVASIINQALDSKHPHLSYSLNRSPLLALFNLLPDRAQLFAIKNVIS